MKFGKKKEKEEDSLSPNGSNDSSSATSTAASPQPPTNVSAPSGKVFGSRLIDNMEIPPIIIQTIEYLEANALQTPGIFRESGSQQQIMQYRTLFEQEKPVVFQPHECHVVASILKLYLRGLQDPLLSFENVCLNITYTHHSQLTKTPDLNLV
ncbi:hypothetical protein PPL_09946 [Heterostelium album PN500]|uniref:Rho-GAP domain-containing protein n=1 Tax=Heterostelium pallidum (strain ATCC 26659 / Pp 5 / PN500) TaxID=670386 RepID=D3BPM1_HETP5|nr:hypothetical protein PPL_09946 [Heterostelium album PN500]EFA76641.1 hypothetical protein PPL_09946 [Heterostelium album PN500]|eukprot:XP_020428773.1 hypothetical protein PPL_09946 [Heterostelium album PN500]